MVLRHVNSLPMVLYNVDEVTDMDIRLDSYQHSTKSYCTLSETCIEGWLPYRSKIVSLVLRES
jgi:hypothetical protein